MLIKCVSVSLSVYIVVCVCGYCVSVCVCAWEGREGNESVFVCAHMWVYEWVLASRKKDRETEQEKERKIDAKIS